MSDTVRNNIIEILKTVRDPEIPVNLYDLGLIYDIAIDGDKAAITMTLTSPNCPVAEMLPEQVRQMAEMADGIETATVELVFDPPWTPDKLTEAGKLELSLMGMEHIFEKGNHPHAPPMISKDEVFGGSKGARDQGSR